MSKGSSALPPFDRLSVRQGLLALLVGVIAGLAFTLIEVGVEAAREADRMDEYVVTIFATIQGSAAEAAYSLDDRQAASIVRGLLHQNSIRYASLNLEDGRPLAWAGSDIPAPALLAAIGGRLLHRTENRLALTAGKPPRPVGELVIRLDAARVAADFLDNCLRLLLLDMSRGVCVALILAVLFNRLLTQPLVRLADAAAAMDPTLPDHAAFAPPPGHERDELGLVAGAVGGLVRRFGTVLEQLDATANDLAASEARYRAIFENIQDIYFEAAPDGRLLEISPSVERHLGLKREALLGRDCREFLADPRDHRRLLHGLMRLGRISDFLARFRLADGSFRLGSVEAALLRDDAGRPRTVHGSIRDVTARSEAEAALRESDERFRMAFHTSPDSININRLRDGLYVDVNDGFTEISGYSREEVIGRTSLEIGIWAEPGRRDDLVARLARDGAVRNFEALFRRKDGSTIPGLMSARVVQLNGEPHLLNITRDIEDLKAAERTVAASEARYRAAFESAPTGMAEIDLDGGLLRVNAALAGLLGFSPEELVGRTLPSLSHPEDRPACQAVLRDLSLGSREGADMEKRFLTRGGEEIWMLQNLIAIPDPNKKPGYILGQFLDITARRMAEQRIAAQLREKEILLQEIHHRVKNNLQIVSSLLSLQSRQFAQGRSDGPACMDPVDALRESRGRILSMALVHEELYRTGDLSRIQFAPYAQRLAQRLIGLYAGSRQVSFELAAESVPLAVNAAIPCGLALNEMLTNALKHGLAGREGMTISVRLSRANGTIRLTVADDGPGFPPGFDPEASDTLGMQLVINLARQLQGTVDIAQGSGARVSLDFPDSGPTSEA